MKTFGEFIKEKRLDKRITLRDFCRRLRIDPSNWSKIERGNLSAPKSKTVLNEIADVLEMDSDSEDRQTLFDLAAIAHIPSELLSDQAIVDQLPVFFRTLRGEKPTRQELEELITLIRKEQ